MRVHGVSRVAAACGLVGSLTGSSDRTKEIQDMATAKKVAAKKAPAKSAAAPAAKPAEKATAVKAVKTAAKKTAATGFNKPLTPSKELAAVIGTKALPRTEVTKKLWEYIKKHKLQDQADKRRINADAKLKVIFKADQVSMFEMTKLVSAHLS
jgi:chromatin remodeling complex protein RSC6